MKNSLGRIKLLRDAELEGGEQENIFPAAFIDMVCKIPVE